MNKKKEVTWSDVDEYVDALVEHVHKNDIDKSHWAINKYCQR